MLAVPRAPVFADWPQAVQRLAWTAIGAALAATSVPLAIMATRRGGTAAGPVPGAAPGMAGVDPAPGIALLPATGFGDIGLAAGLAAALLAAGLVILRAARCLGRTGDAWARRTLACAACAGATVLAVIGLSLVVGVAVVCVFGLPLFWAVAALVLGAPVVLLPILWLVDQAARLAAGGPAGGGA